MLTLFSFLKGLTKISTTTTDNNVFRLHYRFTVIMLAAFSILVTCTQYFGNPIQCHSDGKIDKDLLNTFCWSNTTFSVAEAFGRVVGDEVSYPGVARVGKGEKIVYHKYYQWVCFVLFFQAILCYTPRYLWKVWEGGRIKSLVLGLDSPIVPKEQKDSNTAFLVEYLRTHMNCHTMYFGHYVVCEILNFANIIGQMYLINTFLGGEFTRFGVEVIKFSEMEQEIRFDPMIRVFPRMTKCTFHKGGSSATVEIIDALCVLPLNIINEKIYIFIWFWFVILAILSGVVLAYRLFTAVLPQLRLMMLKSRVRLINGKVIETVMHYAGCGDWFIIYLLTKNLEPQHMRDVLEELSTGLSQKKLMYGKDIDSSDAYL